MSSMSKLKEKVKDEPTMCRFIFLLKMKFLFRGDNFPGPGVSVYTETGVSQSRPRRYSLKKNRFTSTTTEKNFSVYLKIFEINFVGKKSTPFF